VMTAGFGHKHLQADSVSVHLNSLIE
jgi:hypothetical protein